MNDKQQSHNHHECDHEHGKCDCNQHNHDHHDCCDHHNEHNQEHHDCCEHDHGHHDCCEHGHDHHGIESHTHEGAAVVSGNVEITGDIEQIKEWLQIELENLALWIEEQGGIIGHIKAYIEGGGYGTMLSTTGRDVQCKTIANTAVQVNVASIVYGVNIKEVECKVADIIHKIRN